MYPIHRPSGAKRGPAWRMPRVVTAADSVRPAARREVASRSKASIDCSAHVFHCRCSPAPVAFFTVRPSRNGMICVACCRAILGIVSSPLSSVRRRRNASPKR